MDCMDAVARPPRRSTSPFLATTQGTPGDTSPDDRGLTRPGRRITEAILPSAAESPHLAAAEDRELAALRAGDVQAFLTLVNRHHRAMIRVASLYVKSTASAEEVVQETWVAVLRGLDRFEGRASLRSWIFGILVNCARSRAARDVRSVPLSSLERDAEDDVPSVSPDRFLGQDHRLAGNWADPPQPWPDARVESREMLALVREAMAALPEAQRTVMSLRDMDGWDSGEVCTVLGISEGNQRVLLHRARSSVRGYLEQKLGREGYP